MLSCRIYQILRICVHYVCHLYLNKHLTQKSMNSAGHADNLDPPLIYTTQKSKTWGRLAIFCNTLKSGIELKCAH